MGLSGFPGGRGVRGRIRPGKASSLMGFVVGIGFVLLGLLMLGSLTGPLGGLGPVSGLGSAFMIVWLLAAAGVTIYHGYNLFGRKPVSMIDVDIEPADGAALESDAIAGSDGTDGAARSGGPGSELSFDVRLRKLEDLRREGLISEEEYRAKRAEILSEKW